MRNIRIGTYGEENAIRAGDFLLMPKNETRPDIASQPVQNFQQNTWIQNVIKATPKFQEIEIKYDTVSMLLGTEFSIAVLATDPSNVNNPADTSQLSYRWKKNDSQIYQLNLTNGGIGVPALMVESASCVPIISGKYVCEIYNAYGSIETQPITINVYDPYKHSKLYKNLILNGDAEGGLSGWQSAPEIGTTPFLNDISITKNFGSFRLSGFITFKEDQGDTDRMVQSFRFSTASHYGSFFNFFNKRLNADPTFKDINAISKPETVLSGDEIWMTSNIPQIVLNEDYNKSQYAGFFPGLAWMDLYNKNSKVIGLYGDSKGHAMLYFSRNKIKFTKFGGTSTVAMNQTIDISDAADFIDGSVYGVKYITSQFFAYVGAGITDYKIKVQTNDGEKTFNYYIGDSEQVYDKIMKDDHWPSKKNPNFPAAFGTGANKYKISANTAIEIIPIVNDRTTITLNYIDDVGRVLKTEVINGPNASDVWAIKEKVFFPITLYSIFEFLIPARDGNDITVFGQKYTNTKALQGFFGETSLLSKRIENSRTIDVIVDSQITDKAAKFLINKYDFAAYEAAYPGNIWWMDEKKKYKALNDHGAAAMFGVGKNIIVPARTRSVNIKVEFTNNSEAINDQNPELKGWSFQEIYSDEYGNSTNVSRRLVEYGVPRCGITKMKFLLAVNDIDINDKFASFTIPPTSATVLGMQKARYTTPDEFNTADATDFQYKLVMPEVMPEPPRTDDLFIKSANLNSYIQRLNEIEQAQRKLEEELIADTEVYETPSSDEIKWEEDIDEANGDYDNANQIRPWSDGQ